jgi:protocatechuate 3,4-dioxygenase, beta subunit
MPVVPFSLQEILNGSNLCKSSSMKTYILTAILPFFILNSCAQSSQQPSITTNKSGIRIGGPCEGCEAIYETPITFENLSPQDTLPDYIEAGPQLHITGTVYQNDGKTPAANVVLYIYHTDQDGIYSKKGNEKGWGLRHGYIRGWAKTGADGSYTFYTLKPAAYPGRSEPAHIHLIGKEENKNEYYMDDFLFDDDPLLTENHRSRLRNYGGNGIVKTTLSGNVLLAQRDIFLGKNIPNYQ